MGGVQPGGVVLCILLFNTPVDTYISYALNRIFDTGVGMPPEKLQELRHSIAASVHDKTGDASADLAKMDAQNHDSIGILNVNSRMVLYYGADYTLIIDSEEGVGTNIQLRVPYQTSDSLQTS